MTRPQATPARVDDRGVHASIVIVLDGAPEQALRCLSSVASLDPQQPEHEVVIVDHASVGLEALMERLAGDVVAFVQRLRREELFKKPGIAETLDWAGALTELDQVALDPAMVSDTLGVLLKYQDDIARLEGSRTRQLLDEARAEFASAAE